MALTHSDGQNKNYELFRDCLSALLVEQLSQPLINNSPSKQSRRQARPKRSKPANSNSAWAPGGVGQPGQVAGVEGVSSRPRCTDYASTDPTDATVNAGSASHSVGAPPIAGPPRDSAIGDEKVAATTARGTFGGQRFGASPTSTCGGTSDAEELAEFVDYIASITFTSLPEELRKLTHRAWADDPSLQERLGPLPLTTSSLARLIPQAVSDPALTDSLAAYGIITTTAGVPQQQKHVTSPEDLLTPVLSSYISTAITPPLQQASRAKGGSCELCGRDWIDLTYHHLIPRFVHAKAVKRGWHREEDLQNVAWLCGACHRAVHRFAGHEDLARRYYTVEKLLEQEELRRFAEWVGRLRWKKR